MKKEYKNTIVLQEVDSTNNYANRLISSGRAVGGTVVLSYYQKQGRGQRGNRWESAPGKNLLASIILFPAFLPAGKQFYLPKIASLALVDWLRRETTDVSIKWPNDIYVGEKKIAGILIETSVQGNYFHSAAIGIGLNLNQESFSPEIPNSVSLKTITGVDYDINEVAQQLRDVFTSWYRKLESRHVDEIDESYLGDFFRLNKWATFRKENELFEARILGIGEFGQLILEEHSGKRTEHQFKEIEFVI